MSGAIVYPDGVRLVETLAEGDVHVRLGYEVDLDDLLLCIAADQPRLFDRDPEDWWEDNDYPTSIGWDSAREVQVGRFRKQFCTCGEGHAYDVAPVLEGRSTGGSYLGAVTL